MIFLTKFMKIIKLLLLGGLGGLLTLFFMPESPLSFNWSEVNKAWQYHQQISQESSPSKQFDSRNSSQVFSYSKAVEKAGPSVVSIQAHLPGRSARRARNGREGDVLVDFPINVGSGVVFDEDGYIITNHHVILGSKTVSVHFPDGRYKKAMIVGVDSQNDIAVLKVDIPTPMVAELGRSKDVRAGDIILAIGTPFGLFENSVTSGIVSSVDHGVLYPKIQTDAPINYGNSGGALINTLGQVIGISAQKFSVNQKGDTSISFGIPIDIVKEVFDDIKLHGRVIRNWLGGGLNELNLAGHNFFDPGVDFGSGLLVGSIEKGSPVDEAGVIRDDYLVKFDGTEITSMAQFKELFDAIPIGKEVEVELLRNKELIKLKLKLREKNPK